MVHKTALFHCAEKRPLHIHQPGALQPELHFNPVSAMQDDLPFAVQGKNGWTIVNDRVTQAWLHHV
jgi:hypothetical protein